nr:hypothetical protein [uncultured Psychroserpens sp.]
MKSKIAAYTLSEILIVMIISTIVIGLAFMVLSLVQRNMWAIGENLNNTAELNRLEQSLWIDFNRYNNISFSVNEDKLLFLSPRDSISYYFNSEFITRAKDTFHFKHVEKLFFFDGKKIYKGKLDALKLELPKAYGNQQLFVFKSNDASQFMN